MSVEVISCFGTAGDPIAEDSTLLKAITCIPLVGNLVSLFQESSLANKIKGEANGARLVELIDVKNQYKIANVARNLIDAVLIVTGIAFGIIGGGFAWGAILTLIHVGLAGYNIYQIHHNNQIKNELEFRFPTGRYIL